MSIRMSRVPPFVKKKKKEGWFDMSGAGGSGGGSAGASVPVDAASVPPPPPASMLVVPVVMWAAAPPKLTITCIQFLGQGEHLVAGSESGIIILWRCSPSGVTPAQLLTGHSSAITALSPASLSPKSTRFVSASSDGDVSLWDYADGRCVDTAPGQFVHTTMVPHWKRSGLLRASIVICAGEYNDLIVLDSNDLTTIFHIMSRVEPDWCSAFCFVQRTAKPEMCVGITASGMIKIWRMADLDKKDMDTPLYEEESKRLCLSQVKEIAYDTANDAALLCITEHSWNIIDLDDLSIVTSMLTDGVLAGGRIIDVDKVAIAFDDCTLRIYQLPIQQLRGFSAETRFGPAAGRRNFLDSNAPVEFARLDAPEKAIYHEWLNSSSWAFLPTASSEWMAARTNGEGALLMWRLPTYEDDFMRKISTMPNQLPLRYKGTHEASLASLWASLGYKDEDNFPNLGDEHVTCTLYIAGQGRILMGMRDGYIVSRYICEAVASRFLADSENASWKNASRAMRGHKAAVRALLHPASLHPRFDSNLVVSGGDDFAVSLWHMGTCDRLYRFCVNGGPVTRFMIPPENTSKAISKCIVAVGEDSSVALLNVRDFKCQLLATRHTAPVVTIRFRPLDDYMLVKLRDGNVFVWQLETGSIDRVASGITAEDIMAAADEVAEIREVSDNAGATSAVQFVRALRHRNIQAAVKKVGGLVGKDASGAAIATMETPDLTTPVTVAPLLGSTGAHVVLFDVAALINALNVLDSAEEAQSSTIENIAPSGAPGSAVGTLSRMDSEKSLTSRLSLQFESTLLHDLARVLLSLLHAWNLDADLDRVCMKKLGMQPIEHLPTFANSVRTGHLCIFLPSAEVPPVQEWSTRMRWHYASSLSTAHLLAVIATFNTLMALKGSSWTRTKRITSASMRREKSEEAADKQSQCSWSVAIAFHLVLLPAALKSKGASYSPPRLELLARKWQDPCVEVRQAAQALLVRELSRIEASGRRRLIESWAPFLPPVLDPSLSIFGPRTPPPANPSAALIVQAAPPIPPRNKKEGAPALPTARVPEREDGEEWGMREVRRNQATAVVLLAVVGGEFGDELHKADLTRVTALCLLELLVCPNSAILPSHSPLRRAAIDLLGRGFVQWEPHLEIAKVLLGLLALASQGTTPATAASSNMRLSAQSDAQRTARQALTLIARARAPALLSALAMEVARYNSVAQHQTVSHACPSTLFKFRYDVLRLVEEISCSNYQDVVDMMLPLGDLLVHCLDATLLKHRTLSDIFPPITKFSMVAYCPSSRRIAFGGKNGNCVVHDLRHSKTQTLHAHSCPVAALSFSEDGKMLATYGGEEGKINFWQTATSFLGIGQSSLKALKTQAAPSMDRVTEHSKPRLVWISSKAITLMLPDGREQRFAL